MSSPRDFDRESESAAPPTASITLCDFVYEKKATLPTSCRGPAAHSAMVDYSKWDKLDASDDDGDPEPEDLPPEPAQQPRRRAAAAAPASSSNTSSKKKTKPKAAL